jgi:hypothetical protein
MCEREGTLKSADKAVSASASANNFYAPFAFYAASGSVNAAKTVDAAEAAYATAATADYAATTDTDDAAAYAASGYAASTETLITAIDCWVEAAKELTEKAA